MTAVDRERMVVRTRTGEYRSLPRRVALGLIATGRAKPPKPEIEQAARQAVMRLAAALDVPTEVITSDDVVNHWTAGEPLPVTAAMLGPAIHDDTGDITAPGDPLPEVEDEPTRMNLTPPAMVDPPLSEPRGNASRVVWAQYAESRGVAVTDDMTRNEIRGAVWEAVLSADRLPQPAPTGGRLETPEDEPAPEGVPHGYEDPGQQ
jgi:hypothetical protein